MKRFFKIFYLSFFLIFLTNCSETFGLKKLYGTNNLQLNTSQLDRFKDYLKGEYYSFDLGRKVSHKPIMFAISNDGLSSLIFSCASTHTDCNEGIEIYQFLKRFSKKSGKDLKIFALKNKIVWGQNSSLIHRDFDFKNSLIKGINFTKLKQDNNDKNSFYDISILPQDRKDDDFE